MSYLTHGLDCECNTHLAVSMVEIGDWNMDSDTTKAVAHGVTLANIRHVSYIIRNDNDDAYYQVCGYDGANLPAHIGVIDGTNINLSRKTSGDFDSVDFDSTGYNRGWILIYYVK